ncbi:hypothetical protein RVR_10576 [Actinacidiphila reveromycinica]|uniref:Uncharacterized protein n=1 Tax=Actinacidiphila reveromycinica TaxID=659352 RepID=A0A7U3VRC8_9ACTN|nr:hypothetical protein [Streptomyces sp. SN-593]BBB00577.1 hypothetical protein RVR_7710 [Streptomyces sp. SN-593]BBB00630.1 hypothetical protein RVR_10576 [Streptomyces sp. SN-593]
MHDRIAELRGLRAELSTVTTGPRREQRKDDASAIEAAIERIRTDLGEAADGLEAESADLAEQGADGRAGDAAVAARVLRTALDADAAGEADPTDPAARAALAEARGRAMAAANQLQQRRLREHLGVGDESEPSTAAGRKRTAAAAKAPEQTAKK